MSTHCVPHDRQRFRHTPSRSLVLRMMPKLVHSGHRVGVPKPSTDPSGYDWSTASTTRTSATNRCRSSGSNLSFLLRIAMVRVGLLDDRSDPPQREPGAHPVIAPSILLGRHQSLGR